MNRWLGKSLWIRRHQCNNHVCKTICLRGILFRGRDFISPCGCEVIDTEVVWALIWKHFTGAGWNGSKTETFDKTESRCAGNCDGLWSSGHFHNSESFSYCARANDGAVNDFFLWGKRMPPTAPCESSNNGNKEIDTNIKSEFTLFFHL